MQELWIQQDPITHMTARSICALLARHLIRKGRLEDSELVWLKNVMEKLSGMKSIPLHNPGLMDTINLDAFVYGRTFTSNEGPYVRAGHLFLGNTRDSYGTG